MQSATAIAVCLLFAAPLPAEDKPTVKEIPTKDLKIGFNENAKVTAPTEIKTADDLAKSELLKGAADAIKKHVDFSKDKLVVFMWQGSGGDRLASECKTENNKTTATFTLSFGKTFDLRQHTHLFVVPKDAEVKVVMPR